jgi:hypothetical protein
MKHFRYVILLVPVIFTVFAVTGHCFLYRVAVSAACALILLFMAGQFADRSIRWILAALLVSIAGDWFLSHSRNAQVWFLYGIALFLIAHLGFICFCLKNGRINRYVLLPVLTAYIAFFFVALWPVLSPTLSVAVLAYLIVSCFSLAVATGLPHTIRLLFSLGIALLVFSDTIIALKYFMGYKALGFLILPTYFASHIVITAALMRK